jgi:adenosylmethionine---8-amino-7-oxononanoate aminotransferase
MERKTRKSASELVQKDKAFIWHPYTQMKLAQDPLLIKSGKGAYLYAADGKRYLDATSSWWVNLHGHCHPTIVKKISAQLKKLEQVIFAGCTHETAIELADRLLKILPGDMSKIFYTDNGSTAVEAGLKMALQYFYNKNSKTKRIKIICFKGGYHGDTFGAMSAAGKNVFNKPFWNHLFDVETIDPPLEGQAEKSLQQLKAILRTSDSACFIFEPLILGAGGMIIYPAKGLADLIGLCKEHEVITIADEVMTGFGRTNTLFASELLHEKPDIICLSKGLTGGFLPLGVTACKEFIYNVFLSDKMSFSFLHGHSFTANPLACAAALASLKLLRTKKCHDARQRIAESHITFCSRYKHHHKLKRCESIGTILVVEYVTDSKAGYFHSLRDRIYESFLAQGILIRPLGGVLYILPPYCITNDELSHIYNHIAFTLENF